MRKLGWYALRGATAAFVLSSVGLLAANLYVQSHGVQQRIRTALAAALGTPVSLRKTTVTPWDGVRLDGVALREGHPGHPSGAAEFLTAASFRVRLAWWPLLVEHRFAADQVLLDRPRLILREDPDRLLAGATPPAVSMDSPPGKMPAAISPPDTTGTPLPGVVGVEPSAGSSEASVPGEPMSLLLPPIRQLRLRHGEVLSVDREGSTRFRVEGINVDAGMDDPRHARGAAWFTRAAGEMPGAALTDYWTAMDYDEGAGLAIRDGHGSVAGGQLTTDFRLRPQEGRWAFTAAGKLENVALDQLTRASPEQPPLADGWLHGTLDLRGFTGDLASVSGGGRLWMDGARLHNFPLVRLIGQVLRIADLSQLEFKQAELDYQVQDNAVRVEALTLVSNDGQVVLRGQYLMAEDRMDFHGRLTIDRAISRQLPQFIEANFTRCGDEAPGSRYLDFEVTGTGDEPKCNLYDLVTAGPMKGFLDNLLAPRPKTPRNLRPDPARKSRPPATNPMPKP